MTLPAMMQFKQYNKLNGRPNIIVDGSATGGTLLALSHWPGTRLPAELAHDLSAGIAFNYLEQGRLHVGCTLVSNNHFDEDGVVSVYTLIDPEYALKHKDFLIEVASAGDFAMTQNRNAARMAAVISALADRKTNGLSPEIFSGNYSDVSARIYRAILPKIPDMIDHIENYRSLWQIEEDIFLASEAALTRGDVVIEEIPEPDLAIITFKPDFFQSGKSLMHCVTKEFSQLSLFNRIDSFRILYQCGKMVCLQYRYESWVNYVSKFHPPRINLQPLATQLSRMEAEYKNWKADSVNDIIVWLRLHGALESDIAPDKLRKMIIDFLGVNSRETTGKFYEKF